jgi:fructose-1,6-bisphosphatase/inositol monophosphatase family enzyme
MIASKKYIHLLLMNENKFTNLNLDFFIKKKIIPLLKIENKKISSFRKYSSKKTSSVDPVTKHDIRIEKKIRKLINNYYPEHSISGEEFEYKNGESKFEWCIDPIDGTKALIAGQPTWSNMIGLNYDGKPIKGLIFFPELNKYYYSDNNFSYVVEKNKKKKLKSKKNQNLDKSYLITNSIHTLKSTKILNFFKNYKYLFKITGVDALNFCLVAEGKIDILIESGLKKYDIIPHLSILEKSGAVISDWNGGNQFLKGDVVVCGNNIIHKKFINYFKKKIK